MSSYLPLGQFACCFRWNVCPLMFFSLCCEFSVGMDSCGVQDSGLDFGCRQGLINRARAFRFESHSGWQVLTDLGASVGFGEDFSPFLGAFRGVRGDVPPAWER